MIVRREQGGVRMYAHVSTGNYNQSTARVYTDFGYFTAREDVCRDVATLFNVLTANARHAETRALVLAPMEMSTAVLGLIESAIAARREGKSATIAAKLNALVDAEVIRALYRASMAGVTVRLLIRSICCLRPGIAGVSENIEVRSIVGRFLEHSRMVIVECGDERRVFLSSADWMPRNFYRRVEVLLEVPDPGIANQLCEIFEVYWTDNVKARVLMPDGRRVKRSPRAGEDAINAQSHFLERIRRHATT